jgi:hypothetical protein
MDSCIFCLASLFIQADNGIQYVREAPPAYEYLKYDRNDASPWVAAFVVGFQADISPKFSMEFKFRHESMPTRKDYGVDAVWMTATWRPFR